MNTNLKKLVLAMGAVGAMGMAGGAWAVDDSANLTMSATVVNACAISAGTLAFGTLALEVNAGAGTVTPDDHDADSGGSISIVCTKGASANITADLGLNEGAGTVRKMISGASDLLDYELFTDAGRLTILNASNSILYTGTGAATTTTDIFGRITGAQLAAAKKGSYADTVVMTITYSL